MHAIAPRIANATTVTPIPMPALAPMLNPGLLLVDLLSPVATGVEVFDEAGLAEESGDEEAAELVVMVTVNEEDVVEDNDPDVEALVDVELADDENVFASTFGLDVKVTPTGSSCATFPFGSSATSWA